MARNSESMRRFPEERLQKVATLIELHRGQPDISLAVHVRGKMALLGQSVLGRRRIYMDQNFGSFFVTRLWAALVTQPIWVFSIGSGAARPAAH